jgi:hypothetical protein
MQSAFQTAKNFGFMDVKKNLVDDSFSYHILQRNW